MKKVYSIIVNYGMNLMNMLESARCNWHDKDLNSENFPVTKKETVENRFKLVRFVRKMNTNEVEAQLKQKNMRPAELRELLAFCNDTVNFEIPDECSIIALGSTWIDSSSSTERVNVPCVRGNNQARRIIGNDISSDWDESNYFLAVQM